MNGKRRHPVHPANVLDPAATKAPAKALPVVVASATFVSDRPAVEVGTSPVKLLDRGEGRRAVRFYCDGPDRVMIGGKTVTASNGLPIEADQGFVEELAPDAEWWAVSATPGNVIRVQVLS